jgi:hypothetical protein
LVTIHATVDSFDADALILDMLVGGKTLATNTMARAQISKIVVTAPPALAGRKYLVMLPEATGSVVDRNCSSLKVPGTTIVVDLQAEFVDYGPRQIIDFADLKWPIQPPDAASSTRTAPPSH